MAEPSEWVEGEEILDEYEDGDMEVAGDDRSDHGRDGDAEWPWWWNRVSDSGELRPGSASAC